MKKLKQLMKFGAALLVGVALFAGTAGAQPLDNTVDYTNNFDTASSTASWIYWYGNGANNNPMTWDATMDAATNAESGSLLFEATFPSGEQLAFFGTFGNRWNYDTGFRHDATKYTNIVFDVLVDPTSTLSQAGTFGRLQIGFYDGPGPGDLGSQIIPASATNGWVRIVQPINPAIPNLSSVSGIAFRIQTYDNFNNPIGPVKFWIDNLRMEVSKVELPPPTLSSEFTKPVQGLNFLSSAANGGEYQRTSVYYNSHTGVGWLDSPTPVSYAMTITNFPDGFYTNYHAHIFITTGNTPASFATALDYNETNVIFFDVHQNSDGTATAFFRYKVNEENSNANLFGPEVVGPASAGTLARLDGPNVLGTWGFTFNQNTNVTVFGPGGVTTNFNMRAEAVANFVEPLNILFGGQPNRQSDAAPLVNIGQKVVISGLGITNGSTAILSENFMDDTALDTGTFTVLSGDLNAVQLIPAGSAFWMKWSLPDAAFGLQTTTNPANPNAWVTLTGPDAGGATLPSYLASGSRNTLIPTSALGSPTANFFRLIKQDFVKLQILLPGETAAPGTPSGKTGTPTAQAVGVPFPVTINAVDARGYLIAATDTVELTSTDTTASIDPSAPMVGGTVTIQVAIGTAGSYTITATDITDGTKTAATSASVTAN